MFKSTMKVIAGVAALAAMALGGSAIAGAASSSSTNAGTTTSGSPTTAPARPAFNGPAHGTAAHEDAEKPVTGEAAKKAQEAAVKSVGGGKGSAVTTDYTQNGYEVTVTKTDGSTIEVHLDSSFNVIQGPGGHGGAGYSGPAGYGGPPPAA